MILFIIMFLISGGIGFGIGFYKGFGFGFYKGFRYAENLYCGPFPKDESGY